MPDLNHDAASQTTHRRLRSNKITDEELTLTFAWAPRLPVIAPITLIVGLTRPQTARDIAPHLTDTDVPQGE